MVFETIRNIIIDQLHVSEDDVKMDTNLMKDLEADSLDAVEIIMAIEEEYDIEVPDEEAEQFVTVADLVEFVEAKTTDLTKDMLNMTQTDAEKSKIKLAFATAEEITETGDVAELVFTAKAAGTCELRLSSPFMSVEKDGKVVDVEGVQTKGSVITVK